MTSDGDGQHGVHGMDDMKVTELPVLDGAPGPAALITARHAANMVEGALAAQSRAGVVPWARHFAVAAAIVLACGGVASGAYVVRRWRANAVTAADQAVTRVAPRMRERSVASRAAAVTAQGTPPADEQAGEGAGTAESVAVISPRGHGDSRAVIGNSNRASSDNGHGKGMGRGTLASAEAARTDLLQRANVLRAQSRWRDAERVYRHVAALAPGSDEAYAATVAAASLRLERLGDAAGALGLYRRALDARPRGALAEEARWGMAQGYRVLGDAAAEATALRTFVAAHPTSLRRASAERRLANAGAPAMTPSR